MCNNSKLLNFSIKELNHCSIFPLLEYFVPFQVRYLAAAIMIAVKRKACGVLEVQRIAIQTTDCPSTKEGAKNSVICCNCHGTVNDRGCT